MTPTDRNNTSWTDAAADPNKPSILVRLLPQLLHQVTNEVTTEDLAALDVVCKHLHAHVATITPQEHIGCAVNALDTEYRLLGAEEFYPEDEVADSLDVALGPQVIALGRERRADYYRAKREGSKAVLAWFAEWRNEEIRRVGFQDTDKLAFWLRFVKDLLAPMRSGWEPADDD
ncbi:hypothetical protein FN846DRAFT_887403 [Sphaerosporella brunnea]|uniref:Uncharacterized protein n=1 Tax=Sphaerosporella brunnea TaxID=1250544 RepID=A0A5J5F5N9_9PEZI|nr:hypothetical protein FN846DRAFT_887403 [Sphaerosporella brunnea]